MKRNDGTSGRPPYGLKHLIAMIEQEDKDKQEMRRQELIRRIKKLKREEAEKN